MAGTIRRAPGRGDGRGGSGRVLLAGSAIALLVAAPASATMPGRNGVIAFTQSRFEDAADGPGDFVSPDIFTVRPGAGGTRQLTHGGRSTTPAFSPDGRRI